MESANGSSVTAAGSESEKEDPESEELTAVDEPVEAVDELTAFRQQWQRELNISPAVQRDTDIKDKGAEPEQVLTDEEKAKQLFLRGVEFERSGKLYEAIQQYRRAVQIVPDVEARLYDAVDQRDSPEVEPSAVEQEVCESRVSDDEDAVQGEELASRLQRQVGRAGRLCEPEHAAQGVHISSLPPEVVSLILRWVVGSELDVRSLARAGRACRGLWLLARDPQLWRDICLRTWGAECGSPRALGFTSWRHMFAERPRLHPHGCYISKTTYLRHGENSFQDHSYRPWYLVDYYRYLRFFPEGSVLMWTTAEEPAGCVGALRGPAPRPGLGVLAGHYRLRGDQVVVVVKKCVKKKPAVSGTSRFRPRRRESAVAQEQTFRCELTLRRVRSRRNQQLVWDRYSVRAGGRREQWAQFEITPATFPPFHFSRVASYTADSNAPLTAPTALPTHLAWT